MRPASRPSRTRKKSIFTFYTVIKVGKLSKFKFYQVIYKEVMPLYDSAKLIFISRYILLRMRPSTIHDDYNMQFQIKWQRKLQPIPNLDRSETGRQCAKIKTLLVLVFPILSIVRTKRPFRRLLAVRSKNVCFPSSPFRGDRLKIVDSVDEGIMRTVPIDVRQTP